MCMMLFIGADNELPIIKWQQGIGPLVCVGDVPKTYNGVKRHFTTKYQYQVGVGFMGCACAVRIDKFIEIDDFPTGDGSAESNMFIDSMKKSAKNSNDNKNTGRKALSNIFDYIKKYVTADSCELVSFYLEGGSGEARKFESDLTYRNAINISKFDWKSEFSLLDGQHITVYKCRITPPSLPRL